MKTDSELLDSYSTRGCDQSFEELVRRYLPLVRGVVRRKASHLNNQDDLVMEVFASLAKKAASLRKHRSLGGWLVVAARHAAANALRKESNRSRQMKNLATEPSSSHATANVLTDALPVLDDALAALSGAERDAVLLHYYDQLTYREVGNRIGRGEDAARKRVKNALARMCRFLQRRGVVLSVVALGSGLTAQLAKADSAAAAASITSGSLSLISNTAPVHPIFQTFPSLSGASQLSLLAVALIAPLLAAGTGYLAGTLNREQATVPASTHSAPRRRAHPANEQSLRELFSEVSAIHAKAEAQIKGIDPADFARAVALLHPEFKDDPFFSWMLESVLREWGLHAPAIAAEHILKRPPFARPALLSSTMSACATHSA